MIPNRKTTIIVITLITKMMGKTKLPVITVNKNISNKDGSKVHRMFIIDCNNENISNISPNDNE